MTVRSSAFTSFSYLLSFADSHSSTQYFVTYELFLWNTSCFYLLNLQSLSQHIPSHIIPQFPQPTKYWVSISTYNMYLSSEGEVENSSFLQNLCKLMLNWYLKHKSKTNKSQSLQLILQVPHQWKASLSSQFSKLTSIPLSNLSPLKLGHQILFAIHL